MKAVRCCAIAAAVCVVFAAAAVMPTATADLACDDPVQCVGNCRLQCNTLTLHRLSAGIFEGLAKDDGENITVPAAMATLAKDVVVRSVPLGVFATSKTAAEYFGYQNGDKGFAKIFRLLGGYSWGFAAENQVAMAAAVFVLRNMDKGIETNVSTLTTYSFNNVSKVQYMDINFLRFGEAMKRVNAAETLAKPKIQKYTHNYICDIHDQYCTGKLQQYSSRKDCIKFLKSRPMVNSNFDIGGNNNLCRLLHATLLHTDPKVHCPHIGPTGGNACVDGVFDSPESFSLFPLGAFLALS